MRRISRNHVGRDSRKKNCEKKNCVWHSPIIGDGVGMLKPISIAHADPVVPAQYFVPYGRMYIDRADNNMYATISTCFWGLQLESVDYNL